MISIRLFLSSTFLDFAWERSTINNEMVPALRQELAEKGVNFDVVDLRWGVTQDSGLDHSTVTICLDEVRRCCADGARPSFMLLLGDRAGWHPLPTVLDEATYQALHCRMAEQVPHAAELLATWYLPDGNFLVPSRQLRERRGMAESADQWEQVEQEIRKAVLKLASHFDPAVVALFDKPVTEMEANLALQFEKDFPGLSIALRRMPGVMTSATTDEGFAAQARLDALWARVSAAMGDRASQYPTHSGSAPTTGHGSQGDALGDYQRHFRDWFRQSVLREAEAALANRELESESQYALPFLGRSSADNPTPVVARTVEQNVALWLSQEGAQSAPDRKVRLLYGNSGSGKSSVIRRLHADNAPAETAVMLGSSNTRMGPELIIAGLKHWLEGNLQAQSGHPLPILCSVDALDAVPWNDPSEALSWIPLRLSDAAFNGRLLLTTASTDIRDAFASLFGTEAIWTLDEMSDEEARQAIQSDLACAGRCLQDAQLRTLVDATRGADGRALLARIAARIARRLHSDRHIEPPKAHASEWLKLWRRQLIEQMRYGAPMVDAVLAAVCVTRSPVPERLLFDLVSADAPTLEWLASAFPQQTEGFPRVLFSRLLGDLSGVLERESHEGEWTLRFAHGLVSRLLRDAISPQALRNVRETLADRALKSLNSESGVTQWEHDEVLQLLTQCTPPRVAEIERLLSRPAFIAAKCDRQRIPATMADISLLKQRGHLHSTLLQDAADIVRKHWFRLSSLGVQTEREELVWQLVRELPLSSTLYQRALADASAEHGLVVRIPTLSLPGLVWLHVDGARHAQAVQVDDDVVLDIADGRLAILDTEFGRIKRYLPGHAEELIGKHVIENRRLISWGKAGHIAISSVPAGRDILHISTEGVKLDQVCGTPDGGIVATSRETRTIYRWDAAGCLVAQIVAENQTALRVALHPDDIEAYEGTQPVSEFFPLPDDFGKYLPSLASGVLMLDDDRVLLLSDAGIVVWSFATGQPQIILDQEGRSNLLPRYAVICQTEPTLCILLMTLAGSVCRLDLDTGEFHMLQNAGTVPDPARRGYYGGVSRVAQSHYFAWTAETENRIQASLVEQASGRVSYSTAFEVKDIRALECFRGALSSAPRGFALIDSERLLAWSAYGLEIIDFAKGAVVPVSRWGTDRFTTFAHLVDASHVLLHQLGRIVLHDFTQKLQIADLSNWTGAISTMRALDSGKLIISGEDGRVAYWDVQETLAARYDQTRWLHLAGQPMGMNRALLLDDGRVVMQAAVSDSSGQEFSFWGVSKEGPRHEGWSKSHNLVGDEALSRPAPSGWLIEQDMFISWGLNGHIRYVNQNGEELGLLSFDQIGAIEHCISLSDQQTDPYALPDLLISTNNGLFQIKPIQKVAIPVQFSPTVGESFLRAWSVNDDVWVLTTHKLMTLTLAPDSAPSLSECLDIRHLYGERARYTADSTVIECGADAYAALLGVELLAAEQNSGDHGSGGNRSNRPARRLALALVFDPAFNLRSAATWLDARLVWAMAAHIILGYEQGQRFVVAIPPASAGEEGLGRQGFIEQTPSELPVHPRWATQTRQQISPVPGLALTLPGPDRDSSISLFTDRIVYTGPGSTSTWYAPGEYQLLDASDDGGRLLVGLGDRSVQVIDVINEMSEAPWNPIARRIRNAAWMLQFGAVESALRVLQPLLQTAPGGHWRAMSYFAYCDALLAAGAMEQAKDILEATQLKSGEESLKPDDHSNLWLYGKYRELKYKCALLEVKSHSELQAFLASVDTGTEAQRMRQIGSLLAVARQMAVVGAPWLPKLRDLHEGLGQMLKSASFLETSGLARDYSALSYLLRHVLEPDDKSDSGQEENWQQHVSPSMQAELARALNGDGEACCKLGIAFALGQEGLTRSLSFARYWYLKGAAHGDVSATMNAAQMLLRGEGGKKDVKTSLALLETGAMAGNTMAACNLGSLLLTGADGTFEPDFGKARYWLEVAAVAGDAIAIVNLAVLYLGGNGVERSTAKAMNLLAPLADKGDQRALQLMKVIQAQESNAK